MSTTYVEVDGTSRPVQSVSVEWSIKQRGTAMVVLVDSQSTFTVSEGQRVEIGDASKVFFGGTIDERTTVWHPNTACRFYRLRCISYEQIASRRRTGERSYERQLAGDIIRDLVTNCLDGEGIDVTDVQDGPEVGPIKFDFATVEEAFDQVAALAGYYWDIIYNQHLRFFDRTIYSAPWSITATSAEVRNLGMLSSVQDRQKVANRVYVRLGQYLAPTETESYPGDGTSTQFNVLNPIGATPVVRVNGADQIVGIQGVDTGHDWYWNVGSQTLYQDELGVVLTAADTIEITYTPMLSKTILGAADLTAISDRATLEGLSGIYDAVIEASTATTQADAESMAEAYLAANKDATSALTFDTLENDLEVGQVISVNLPALGLNDDFLIETLTYTDSVGKLPNFQATCSSGAILPTWQQVFGGGTSSSVSVATQAQTEEAGFAYPDRR